MLNNNTKPVDMTNRLRTNALLFLALIICLPNTWAQNFSQKNREEFAKFLNQHPFLQRDNLTKEDLKKIPKQDRPDLAWELDYLTTLDPATGSPEKSRLFPTLDVVDQLLSSTPQALPGSSPQNAWAERGPNNVGGRTRALMWDPNDATGKKVWAGGVTGGLWYNNDITSASSQWQAINDFWDNIAVTCIAYDPNNSQIFYVGTGEGYGSTSTSRGAGIWKSTNGGVSFTRLTSTNSFFFVNDIVVRNENGVSVVYAAVDGNFYNGVWHGAAQSGLQRSTNGGTSWNQVLPNIPGTSTNYVASDLEIGPTNRLWVGTRRTPYSATDRGGGRILYSDNGTTWTTAYTSPNISNGSGRVELACAPSNANYIYGMIENNAEVHQIVRTIDNGSNWSSLSEPNDHDLGIPATDFSRGQAWYDLILAVSPTNPNVVIAGAINAHMTTNGGSTWSQISKWSNNPNMGSQPYSYIHADHHNILFKPGSANEVIFGTDGGVFWTNNVGNAATSSVFQERNNGYNVTQFYAGAIHPTSGSNIMVAGSQDNGTQRYTGGGINSTNMVTGGDGAYCFIDQTNGFDVITSYVYNNYYHLNNSGSSFVKQFLNDNNTGLFINPADLDDANNILYSNLRPGKIYKISNYQNSFPTIDSISISGISAHATAIKVSPFNNSANVFVGDMSGNLVRINNANGSSPTFTNITGTSFPNGTISSIEFGTSESQILVTIKNYGVPSVFYSANGGSTWSNKEGNLPDMPVRWGLINPNNGDEAILATEVGVWATTNFTNASPSWFPSNSGLANVRVDMLQYRASDNTVMAITHGRGVFTSNAWAGSTSSPTSSKVRFRVNMNNQVVSANGVHIAGNFQSGNASLPNWNPGGIQLFDSTGTGIYEVVLDLLPGTYEFKFNNDNTWNGNEEVISGCNAPNTTNRQATIFLGDTTLPAFCFNACAPCVNNKVFYNFDFANGLPIGWSNSGSATNALWEYRGPNTTPNNSVGSRGAFANPAVFLQSNSQSNGFMIFDSDYLDDPNGAAGTGVAPAPHAGGLYTQTLDFSGKPNVILELQSFFRPFASAAQIIFSTNGGNSYSDTISLHQNLLTNVQSANAELIRVNISSYVGGQSNVKVGFIFNGYDPLNLSTNPIDGYYYWMIDDIKFIEQPKNDLNLTASSYTVGNLQGVYGRIPLSLQEAINFNGILANEGTVTQPNSKIQVNQGSFTYSSGGVSLAPGTSSNVNTTASYFPFATGNNNFAIAAISDSTEQFPSNNSRNVGFLVTDSVYSLDRGVANEFLGTNSWANASDTFIVANVLEVSDSVYFTAASVNLSAASTPGGKIQFEIWDYNSTTTGGGGKFGTKIPIQSAMYTLTSQDITAGFIKLPMQGTLSSKILAPGKYYLGAVMYGNNNADTIRIPIDRSVAQNPFSSVIYIPFTSGFGGVYTNPVAGHISGFIQPINPSTTPPLPQANGDTLYLYDFNNGLPTGWTNSGSTANTLWEYRGVSTTPSNSTGSRGAFANSNVVIQSPTQNNGFMIFDSDYLDDPNGANGVGVSPAPHVGSLITEALNFSNAQEIIIQFNSYFRTFESGAGLAFSYDGGVTFPDTAFIHTNLIANQATPLNEEIRFDASAFIGGKPNVKIAFVFDGRNPLGLNGGQNQRSYYFWMIDDVKILQKPGNDLMAFDVTLAQPNTFGEHSAVPQFLAETWIMNGRVINNGRKTATDVSLYADINSVFGSFVIDFTSSNVATLPAGDTTGLLNFSNFYFNNLETYQFGFRPASDSTEDYTFGDTIFKEISITQNEYQLHRNVWSGALGTNSFTGSADSFIVANQFPFKQSVEIDTIVVNIGNASRVGATLIPVVYSGDFSQGFTQEFHGTPYTLTAADTQNFNAQVPVNFTVDSGVYYIGVMLSSNSNANNVTVIDDLSEFQHPNAALIRLNNFWYTNGNAFHLTLNVSPPTPPSDTLYTWDFNAGLPSNWTNSGSTTNTLWEYRGPNTTPNTSIGSRGAFVGVNGPIQSKTTNNGFMIFDSDYLDDPNGANGVGVSPAPHAGAIYTQTLDFSSDSSVYLQFESFFRTFESGAGIVISTDGGLTYTDTVFVHTNLIVNQATANSELVRLDISDYVGGQSNVKLGFLFDGYNPLGLNGGQFQRGYYFWMIDDVVLLKQPNIDLAPLNIAVNTPNSFGQHSAYPNFLYQDLTMQASITNLGKNPVSNARVYCNTTSLSNTFIPDFPSSQIPVLLPGDTVNNLSFANLFSSFFGGNDTYYLTFYPQSDSAEGYPGNDTIKRQFEVTNNYYSLHSNGGPTTALGTFSFPNFGSQDGFELLNHFYFKDSVTINNLVINFANGTRSGGNVVPVVYSGDFGSGFNQEFYGNAYTITQADSANRFGINIPANATLPPGAYYVGLELNSNSGTNNISILNDERVQQHPDAAIISLPQPSKTFYNNGNAFHIAINVSTALPQLAQIDLPITWDDTTNIDYSTLDFGGAISNTMIDPGNTNNRILKTVKPVGAQTWAGTILGNTALASTIPFAPGATTISAIVFSPDSGSTIKLKAEVSNQPSLAVETDVITTKANQWDTLVFDFTNHTVGTPQLSFNNAYNQLVIFYDFNVTPSVNKTFYLDNVYFGGSTNQSAGSLPYRSLAVLTTENSLGVADSNNLLCITGGIVASNNFSDVNAPGPDVSFAVINSSNTFGITAISFNPANLLGYTPQIGDSILMFGTVNQFNGLTQFELDSVQVQTTGNQLPWESFNFGITEADESRLIRLDNVTLVNPSQWPSVGADANVDIEFGGNIYTMRVDRHTDIAQNLTAPTGRFNVIGIGSQFDASAPFTDGYQILPRSSADIIPLFAVTFRVNMANETIDPNGPHVAGEFRDHNNDGYPENFTNSQWFSSGNPMVQDSANPNLYFTTIYLQSDSIEYKFLNGNQWGQDELLTTGSICTKTTGQFINRIVGISADTILGDVCFESCAACAPLCAPIAVNPTMITSVSCFGGNDGAITVSATGGTAPYNFNWNFAQGASISGLFAGQYKVYVTDSANCLDSALIPVSQPAAPLNIALTGVQPIVRINNANGTNFLMDFGFMDANWGTTNTGALVTGNLVVARDGSAADSLACAGPLTNAAAINGNIAIVYRGNCEFGAKALACQQAGATAVVVINNNNLPAINIGAGLVGNQVTIPVVHLSQANGSILRNLIKNGANITVGADTAQTFDPLCFGDANGQIQALVNGGTSPYSYQWSNNLTTRTISGLTQGQYTLNVTDANGCQLSDNLSLIAPQQLSVALNNATAPSSASAANGSIEVNVSGGTQPYNYLWNTSPAQTTSTANNLGVGNYQVTVTDFNNCSAVFGYALCVDDTTTSTIEICQGDTASIFGNQQTVAGVYYQTYTSALGCDSVYEVILVVNNNPIIGGVNVAQVTGCGTNDGSISLQGVGAGTITYALNTGQTQVGNGIFTGLFPATYVVTVTDTNGCSNQTSPLVINAFAGSPSVPTLAGNTSVNYCFGDAILPFTASGGNGQLYWYNNANLSTPIDSGASFTPPNVVGFNSYYVAETFNNCQGPPAQVFVQITSVPNAPNIIGGGTYCDADSILPQIAQGIGIEWFSDSALTNLLSTGNQLNVNPFTVVGNNNFVATSTVNGCQSTLTGISIQVIASPVAPTVNNVAYCDNEQPVALLANLTAGNSARWYSDVNLNNLVSVNSSFIPSSTVGTNNYYVTQFDGTCESASTMASSTVYQSPTFNFVSTNNVSVCGASDGSIVINAQIYNAGGKYSIDNGASYQASNTFNGLATAGYLVTAADTFCQALYGIATITAPGQPLSPQVSGNDTICNGDSYSGFTAIAQGAGNLTWYNSPLLGASNQVDTGSAYTPSSLNVGANTYYVTETQGICQGAASAVTILVNALPNVNAGADKFICIEDSALLVATGASNYQWIGVGNNDSVWVAPTTNTQYSVIGTSAQGCVNTDSLLVTVNALPTVSAGSLPSLCIDNGNFVLPKGTPSGGQYNGANIVNNTLLVASAGIGTHPVYFSFSDANSCTAVDTTSITIHGLPTVTLSAQANICANNAAVGLTGGLPAGGTYIGVGVSGGSFDPALAGGSGIYTIVYSFTDVNGCTSTDTNNIEVDTVPVITWAPFPIVCETDAKFSLTEASPAGGTYSGNGVSANSFDPVLAGGAGTYVITYQFTDANSCSNSGNQNLTVGSLPVVNLGDDTTLCNNIPSIDLNAGAGATFEWYLNGSLTTQNTQSITVDSTNAGTYVVIVTNADGCSGSDTIVVNYQEICTGISTVTSTTIQPASIYPNPTSGTFTIEYLGLLNSDLQLEVYSANGQLIYQKQYFDVQGVLVDEIIINQLASGIYYVKLKTETHTEQHKLIVR